jgi:hypothetical protein
MKFEERYNLFLKSLRRISEEGGENNYLIMKEPQSEKFLAYTSGKGQDITIDIPYNFLSKEEKKKFVEQFALDFIAGTYSFSKEVPVEDATHYSEKIFKDIFQFGEEFDLDVEIGLD